MLPTGPGVDRKLCPCLSRRHPWPQKLAFGNSLSNCILVSLETHPHYSPTMLPLSSTFARFIVVAFGELSIFLIIYTAFHILELWSGHEKKLERSWHVNKHWAKAVACLSRYDNLTAMILLSFKCPSFRSFNVWNFICAKNTSCISHGI